MWELVGIIIVYGMFGLCALLASKGRRTRGPKMPDDMNLG